ncbi:MAG: acetylxylan esterase [Acidobacteria bacterium]|nr:acetylxylan esterase [Acidobacteriota bacterium]
MALRTAMPLLFATLVLHAEVPVEDIRLTHTPETNTQFPPPKYASLGEWKTRRALMRRQILTAAGLDPMPEKTPLNAEVFGRVEGEGYTVERVLLETMPGFYLGGNLYRPARGRGKRPGVLTPHGHWQNGRLHNTVDFSGPALGIHLAKQGYVSFAYDMVGYNDTMQVPHRWGNETPYRLWSFGPLGLQLWNSMRALDFLTSLADVDPKRIAVAGASGGGTQTFLLAAVDDRVKAAAPVNMVSLLMQGGCVCENAPGLRLDATNVDIAAMTAPRPMLLVSATGDWTKNVPKEEFPAIQSIYKLYGKPGNVSVVQYDYKHNFNRDSRQAVYRFFNKTFFGKERATQATEQDITIDVESLRVLKDRTLPARAKDMADVFEYWKSVAREQASAADPAGLRERLMRVLAVEWPARVDHSLSGEAAVLGREGRGDRVPGIWMPAGGDRAAVIVHPAGAHAPEAMETAGELKRLGVSVLAIDAFKTVAPATPAPPPERHFFTFNRSDDANRVQDVLTAAAFLAQRGAREIDLVCEGRAQAWCLFAAAVAPVKLQLRVAPPPIPDDSDEWLAQNLFVPGIQRAGGLEAALRLTGASVRQNAAPQALRAP